MHDPLFYIKIVLSCLILFLIACNITYFILLKIRHKKYIQMDIINNADLPIKRLVVNPNLAAPNYRAVYLITSNYYDLETIKYQALNGDFREYPNYEISGSQYVVVDINQKFSDGDLFVIEDNYTKAIFVISKSDEYFYFDIKYPKLSHYRFRSRHNVNGKARISRDEMNYFTILGKFIGIIEFE